MSAGCMHMTRERTWRDLQHLGRKACCIGAVVSLAEGLRLVRCSARRVHYGNRCCSRSTRYVESARSTRAGAPSPSMWSIATPLTPLSSPKTPPTSQKSASLTLTARQSRTSRLKPLCKAGGLGRLTVRFMHYRLFVVPLFVSWFARMPWW